MKNFLEALYKTIYSLAFDVIAIVVALAYFLFVWRLNKVFAIIVYALFTFTVYLEANKVNKEGDIDEF